MNNEPVAWMVAEMVFDTEETAIAIGKTYDDEVVPLYTHPVKEQDESFDRTASHMAGEYVAYKELTDEEIKSEAKYLCHGWHSENPERLVLFARAILRKAQEK